MKNVTVPAVLLSLAISSLLLRADEPLKTDTRLLMNFEDPVVASSLKTNSAEATVVAEGTTEGSKALRLKFLPPAAYPAVHFLQSPAADFRGYGGIVFDAYNPTDDTVAFGVRVDSSEKADGNGNHSRSGKGSLDGHQRATFVMPFGVDPASLKMKALPGF